MGLIQFTNEQKLIEGEIRKFAQTELEPIVDEIDKKSSVPEDILKKLSDLGFLSLVIPETFGGTELDTTSLCIVLEELGKVSASVATILAVHNCLAAFPLIKYGSENNSRSCLKKMVEGSLGSFALQPEVTIPEKRLELKKSNGMIKAFGKRDFVLNGENGEILIVPFTTDNEKILFVVERNQSVKTFAHNLLGLRASGIVGYDFNGVGVADQNILVSGEKFDRALSTIQAYANIGFSAVMIGLAEAAFEASVNYAKERKQFKRAICEFPMVREMLSKMRMHIEAGRLVLYNAAKISDEGTRYEIEAAIARLCCAMGSIYAGIKSIQVHGGYGYTKDYPVERYLRDAKSLEVILAPPHDLKAHIAKELLQ